MQTGRFYPDHGLERIVAYHERQDRRFAEAAAEVSDRDGKPVLTATELAVTAPDNPGPAAVRASGRLCYPSANRAVTALEHLWRYARHRAARSMRTFLRGCGAGSCPPSLVAAVALGALAARSSVQSRATRATPVSGLTHAPRDAGAVRDGVWSTSSCSPWARHGLPRAATARGVAHRLELPARHRSTGTQVFDVHGDDTADPRVDAEAAHRHVGARRARRRPHATRTSVQRGAAPVGGVVNGDLWLVGRRRPAARRRTTTSHTLPAAARPVTSLEALADSVVAAGVTQITGRVVGDERGTTRALRRRRGRRATSSARDRADERACRSTTGS